LNSLRRTDTASAFGEDGALQQFEGYVLTLSLGVRSFG
jgi:hypothetical protein